MNEDEIKALVEEKVKISLKTRVVLVALGFVAGVVVTGIVVSAMNNKVEEVVESLPETAAAPSS
jgi:hypothetical protein